MHETRTIFFTPVEVQQAVSRRALDKGLFFRGSSQLRCEFGLGPDKGPGLNVSVITDAGRHGAPVRFHESEVVACLVDLCITTKVPLPRRAEKRLRYIDDEIALVMDMR
jgi:hypothetical protein